LVIVVLSSMIVYDLNFIRVAIALLEANPPLIADPNTMLARAISM